MIEHTSSSKTRLPRALYTATAAITLGGFVIGYDFASIAGAILDIQEDFGLSSTTTEMTISAAFFGATVGALLSGRIADRFGRRTLLVIVAAAFIAGTATTSIAPSTAWLIAGRAVVGVAIGMAFLAGPLYLSEVSPDHVRGRLISLNTLAMSVGVLLAYLADFLLETSRQWRVMLGIGILPALACGLAVFFLPDTPHWYMARRMKDRAREIHSMFRAPGSDIEGELRRIEKAATQSKGGWGELLKRENRPVVFVGAGLGIMRSVTGMALVTVYAPTILNMGGFASQSMDMLATVALGILMILSKFVAVKLIDRWGRRPLLLQSLIALTVGFFALGAIFLNPTQLGGGFAVLLCLALLAVAFNVGPAPVVPVLLAEIYPLHIRAMAMSLSTTAMWIAYIAVTSTFLSFLETPGQTVTFWLYAAINLASLIFVYRFVSETKGRSLEGIDAQYGKGS